MKKAVIIILLILAASAAFSEAPQPEGGYSVYCNTKYLPETGALGLLAFLRAGVSAELAVPLSEETGPGVEIGFSIFPVGKLAKAFMMDLDARLFWFYRPQKDFQMRLAAGYQYDIILPESGKGGIFAHMMLGGINLIFNPLYLEYYYVLSFANAAAGKLGTGAHQLGVGFKIPLEAPDDNW